MPELSPEQWAQAQELFAGALELSEEDREGFLRRECANDDLRQEVSSLLEHAVPQPLQAGAAIADAAASLAREIDPDARLIGSRLGPYRVEAIAGYGGMGAVYQAARVDDEFHQRVAIKLVRAAAESPAAQQRFRQERQILARLSHPNIARLLDGGSTPEGVPYLVMEYIEGQPITAWCDAQSLPLELRLRLFLPVCEGVEAANRELVIHRDLKPANILVTREGVPKLLDFGIAKMLDPDDRNLTFTATRFQAMTPEYTSPEQVRGERSTAATDVYSLGLILYEMLTGQKAQELPECNPDRVARVVCHMEPAAPATLKPHLSGDLDNIIRMAIRKEPERRYQTAAALADDVRLYLAGRPVTARPDTLAYRADKFLRRNRTAVKAAVVSAVCVGGAIALVSWLGAPSRPPRVLQVTQLTRTGRIEIGSHVVTDGARLYFSERTGGRWALAQVPVSGGTPAPLPLPLMNPTILDISPDRSRLLVTAGKEVRGDAPVWIVPLAGGVPRRVGNIRTSMAAWSRDGKRIFFISGIGIFRVNVDGTDYRKLVDVPDGLGWIREAPVPGPEVLRFSRYRKDVPSTTLWEIGPDGAGLHPALRWEPSGPGSPDAYYGGGWIPSGRYYFFLSGHADVSNFLALREGRGLLSFLRLRPVQIYSTPLDVVDLTPSPDGKKIFFAGGQERRELVRYNAGRKQFLPFLPGVAGRHVSFSKDGSQVAYTTVPQDLLWKSRVDGSGRVQLTSPGMQAGRPQWSPDGKSIAFTGNKDGQPGRVYVIPSGGGTLRLVGAEPYESDASWSPDGNWLLLARRVPAGAPGRPGLYLLDWKSGGMEFVPGSESFLYAAWSPNSRYIAATGEDAQAHVFDFQTRRWAPLAEGTELGYPFWSHDGKFVYIQDVLGAEDQPIFRVRIGDGRIERMMSGGQIPQSDVTGYTLSGLGPDDSPIATVIRSNSDIYALGVDLP